MKSASTCLVIWSTPYFTVMVFIFLLLSLVIFVFAEDPDRLIPYALAEERTGENEKGTEQNAPRLSRNVMSSRWYEGAVQFRRLALQAID